MLGLLDSACLVINIISSIFEELMVVTHSQETCTRNLYKSTWFLVQDFSCTSFLHRIQHSSIPYKKLAICCTKLI